MEGFILKKSQLDNGIESLQNKIVEMNTRLESLKRNGLNNDICIADIENQISVSQKKLEMLIAKKSGLKIPPKYGDIKYYDYKTKESIDMLIVLYYDYFKKDPSISLSDGYYPMFGDDTLRIISERLLVKGKIPFNLMLTCNHTNYLPNDNGSVAVRFHIKNIDKQYINKYMELFSILIKKYTDNDINLILSDASFEACTLAYISNSDFDHYYSNEKTKLYYDFFNCLCDNIWRNIIYIGDTMKQNALEQEIEKVNSDFVVPHKKFTADNIGISYEKLTDKNEAIKKMIL